MIHTRHFWYNFFSDLGFLIMPCGFNYHSNTSWLFDGGAVNEVALGDDENFKIVYTGIHCFFYQISAKLLKRHLALLRLTDTVIRRKLESENIELNIPAQYQECQLFNVDKYDGKKYLKGFALREFTHMISAITNQIDPIDWQKNGRQDFDYLGDFETYGFCFLSITRL